ncbi:MAG: DUF2029 domain-containing protein [Anaerolineales bacterium]|nr:MAG: DUF2029 domain-containing protein [Anaerolineales bacterium]
MRLARVLRNRYTPVVVAFLAMRLMMLSTLPADNLTLYGDYAYYYELASYSDQGQLPFIDYWSEYPPLFPFLSVGLYQLSSAAGGGYHLYVQLMGLLMAALSTGGLVLLLRLARRLHGAERAERLGWFYTALFVPLMYTWWSFDALPVFCLLLTLELLLSGRERWSAVSMGVGVLAKLIPALVFLAVLRTRPWRRWLSYGLIAAVVVGAVAVPLLAAGGEMAAASFLFPFRRSAWQTVWALLEGNVGTGLLGSPADHLDLTNASGAATSATALGWVSLLVLAGLYAIALHRARLEDRPDRLVAFVTLALVLFFLFSKGWSQQWQCYLYPLVLLVLPLHRSLLFIIGLSLVNLVEWPVLLSRGMNQWMYLTVPLRTALLALLAAVLWRRVEE